MVKAMPAVARALGPADTAAPDTPAASPTGLAVVLGERKDEEAGA